MALFTLLAVTPAGSMSRDKLLAYLWPEKSTRSARNRLNQTVHALRRALGSEALLSQGVNLALDPEVVTSDVRRFEEALDQGDLERAVALYRGPLLDGFFLDDSIEFERWLDRQRARLRDAYLGALERLAEAAVASGRRVQAAEWWRRLAREEPFNSRVILRLMDALESAGDPAGAIRCAREHAARLEQDLGAKPPPAIRARAERIRTTPAEIGGAAATDSRGGDAELDRTSRDAPTPTHVGGGPKEFAVTPVDPPPASQPRLGRGRKAALGALVALLGLGTAAYMAMRSAGAGPFDTRRAKGDPGGRGRIVLGDFEAPAGDSLAARMVTEALRVDLEQSPVVRLLEPRLVGATLVRMGHGPGTPLDPELATELAVREGARAILGGEVHRAGGSLVIYARLVSPEGGEVLATFRETASDSHDLVPAVDRLSAEIRSKIGESLRSVRASPPLERFMTESLDALRLATEGVRSWRTPGRTAAQAAELLREAVEIDPSFPMAHTWLALVLRDGSMDRAGQIEAMSRAFELRDRLPEAERLTIEGTYYSPMFRNEPEKSLQALRAADVLDSMQAGPIGWVQRWSRRDEQALAAFRRAVARDTLLPLLQQHLIRTLWNLERFQEADSVLAVLERRFPDPHLSHVKIARQVAQRDFAEAESVADAAAEGIAGAAGRSLMWKLRLLALARGRLDRAWRLGEAILEAGDLSPVRILFDAASDATADVLLTGGDPGPWLARLDSLAARLPEDFSPLDGGWGYFGLVGALATLGAPERARAALKAYEHATPEGFLGQHEPERFRALGRIALAEGSAEEAARAFRASDVGPCQPCALPWLARAHDLANEPDSVLGTLERFLEPTPWLTPGSGRTGEWLLLLEYPLAHERLGQLYDARGDLENAADHYARFVELWKDADPELQPRVEAARERLKEITTSQAAAR